MPAPPPADSLTAADSTGAEYVLDRLVAGGKARSLYRLPPSDTTAKIGVDPPALHYVLGNRITIVLTEGQVDRMEVDGPTQGLHLEPLARPEADSTGIRPDTASRADTRARPDTTAEASVAAAAGSQPRPAEQPRRSGVAGAPPLHALAERRSARIPARRTHRPPGRSPDGRIR